MQHFKGGEFLPWTGLLISPFGPARIAYFKHQIKKYLKIWKQTGFWIKKALPLLM